MYFSSFPVIPYTLDEGRTWQYLRDITIRTRLIEEHFNQVSMYNYFIINDGASPEDIATEIYGTPYLHWVILMCNDIIDPMVEWPFNEQQLRNYIWRKYRTQVLDLTPLNGFIGEGSILIQHDGDRNRDIFGVVKHVEHDLYATTGTEFFVKEEGDTILTVHNSSVIAELHGIEWNMPDVAMQEIHHYLDSNGTIVQTTEIPPDNDDQDYEIFTITNYRYESELNEKNREIRILRPDYIRPFIDEFKRLINE